MSKLLRRWIELLSPAILAVSFNGAINTAEANHDCSDPKWIGHPHCQDGGGGSPSEGIIYQVDVANDPGFISEAPVYNPPCDAFTPGGTEYAVVFDRHDLCATVMTSTGATLTDDIRIAVQTNRAGEITALQLTGQDVIGKAGVFHESEEIMVEPPVMPAINGFTIEVYEDNLPIYKCDKHLRCNNRIESIGEIAIDLMIYTPTP